MEDVIAFTKSKLPYGWMGNMSPYKVTYLGVEYLTSEALFQCLRFSDVGIQALIRREKSPMGAKLVTKREDIRQLMTVEPLSHEDRDNMRLCIALKLLQHPDLQEELLATGERPIYEDVTARGAGGSNLFWGALFAHGEWFGKNVLGQIWMENRTLLGDENGYEHLKEFEKFS